MRVVNDSCFHGEKKNQIIQPWFFFCAQPRYIILFKKPTNKIQTRHYQLKISRVWKSQNSIKSSNFVGSPKSKSYLLVSSLSLFSTHIINSTEISKLFSIFESCVLDLSIWTYKMRNTWLVGVHIVDRVLQ